MPLQWMKFKTRDWLDSKELRSCSRDARSLLMDLICLAAEGTPYGHLRDKFDPLPDTYLISRCHLSKKEFERFLDELVKKERVVRNPEGVLIIPQMIEQERIRHARAEGGKKGGNPKLNTEHEGYPSDAKNGLLQADHSPRARAPLASSSVVSVSSEGVEREDPLIEIARMLRQWGERFGVVIEPDVNAVMRLARKMYDAGKNLDDFENIIRGLIAEKQKPKSMGHAIVVVEGRLSYVAERAGA